jgi:prolyl-tRNA synthetase
MMKEKDEKGINVKKEDDMPLWYSQIIQKADLAEPSSIKGFMVIKPNGYSIWEHITEYFNNRIKKIGVRNAYFPLLIPESFFKKEAEHAVGFDPDLAWVNRKEDGERLAIRPTSETIMYDSYSRWIRSYRDLPLRINQWCNVLRWEVKQTKIFLRTREFLWQEGHCVYETKEECDKEVKLMLEEYAKLCKDLLAIEVITGKKTENEKFPGALYTSTMEALMPDGKALQMGTSHNLGQGFAKSFNISFQGRDEKEHTPWQSSWGFSTRLLGAIIMTHSDDKGLILPPKVALNKVVIIPILFDKTKSKVLKKAKELEKELKSFNPILDSNEDYSPGWKYNEYELKGIPIRIEIGPRDVEKNQVVLVRRDTLEKEFIKIKDIDKKVKETLEDIHTNLYKKSKQILKKNIVEAKTMDQMKKAIKDKKMAISPFCDKPSCEELIKDATGGATGRCIKEEKKGKCIHCGKDSNLLVYFAKSY